MTPTTKSAGTECGERLQAVRADYDRVADEYARRLYRELEGKPFDRELLHRFAIATRGRGVVCDMGCGPGHVARFLRDAGVSVTGLDFSPRMLDQARTLNPGIRFYEGNMLALAFDGGELAGITAFYSIVNIPGESLDQVFREMNRVLASGGLLLVAFHMGDEVVRPAELWGLPVSMEFFYFQTSVIKEKLRAAGFAIVDAFERGPYAPEVEYQSRRAYIFSRKPAPQAA